MNRWDGIQAVPWDGLDVPTSSSCAYLLPLSMPRALRGLVIMDGIVMVIPQVGEVVGAVFPLLVVLGWRGEGSLTLASFKGYITPVLNSGLRLFPSPYSLHTLYSLSVGTAMAPQTPVAQLEGQWSCGGVDCVGNV